MSQGAQIGKWKRGSATSLSLTDCERALMRHGGALRILTVPNSARKQGSESSYQIKNHKT